MIFRTIVPVTPVNHPPTAGDDSVSTNANTPLTIPAASLLLNDSDPDSEPLTIVEVSATSVAGSSVFLDEVNGDIVYTPASHFVGTDSFSYRVRDAHGWMAEATVTITVEFGSAQISGTLTADNHYGLYFGPGDGSQLAFVGRNESGTAGDPGAYNWTLPETWIFEPGVDDYIYVVAWDSLLSGNGGPQMWIGDFEGGNGTTLLSNLNDWEFIIGGVNPTLRAGMETELPPTSELMNSISLGTWAAPLASAANGTSPWNTVADISGSAEFIWNDTLAAASPSEASYIVFRARMPSMVQATASTVLLEPVDTESTKSIEQAKSQEELPAALISAALADSFGVVPETNDGRSEFGRSLLGTGKRAQTRFIDRYTAPRRWLESLRITDLEEWQFDHDFVDDLLSTRNRPQNPMGFNNDGLFESFIDESELDSLFDFSSR